MEWGNEKFDMSNVTPMETMETEYVTLTKDELESIIYYLKECASDLEAYVCIDYPPDVRKNYRSMKLKFERDIEPVKMAYQLVDILKRKLK